MYLQLRIPPLAVTAIAALLAWSVVQALPMLVFEYPGRAWLTVGFGLMGMVSSVLGVGSFRRARTTVNPLTPDATTALVVSGIYRVTRNPMYLGFLLFLIAELAWLAHPIAWLMAPAFVVYLNCFQIEPEEQALSRRFGTEYSLYAARVRRWL